MVETAIHKEQIKTMLGWGERKFYRRRKELMDAGVVFHRYEGSPPKRRVCAFPSRIHKWIRIKTDKGEMI